MLDIKASMVSGPAGLVAQIKAGQGNDHHVLKLPPGAHGSGKARCLPHMIAPGAFKDNGGIGQCEKAYAHAKQALSGQQYAYGRIHGKKGRNQQAKAAQPHAHCAHMAGVKLYAQPGGQRGGHGLHQRLQGQKHARLLDGHATPKLQIQAEEKRARRKMNCS